MLPQQEAILKLLSDDDPETVALVKNKLSERGPDVVPELRELLKVGDAKAAGHIRDVLGDLEHLSAVEEFARCCAEFSRNPDLEKACWLLAPAIIPGVETEPFIEQVDRWGVRFTQLVASVDNPRHRVEILSHFLSQEIGLQGNADDYYDIENSLLPCVIESKLGIPISLSVVYMIVARRAGIEIRGINFPGHFIVRHEDVLFDPFEGGRVLLATDCKALLERQGLTLCASHLAPANPCAILMRILTNILYIAQADDPDLHDRVRCWMALLSGSTTNG